mgnify:CR=1 FL=1
MSANKSPRPQQSPVRPIYANESGPRPRKRGKLDKNRGETDDSTDKTSLDDLQCGGTPEQEEEENENEGEEEEKHQEAPEGWNLQEEVREGAYVQA